MTGIAAIHHPLRNVDAGAGDIHPIVHISDLIDGAAVRTHPETKSRIILQEPTDFQGAVHRFLQALEKDQRHPVSRGDGNELAMRLAPLELRGFPHELVELLHDLALLVDEQFRVTDHVHEQHMRDLEVKMRFLNVWHLYGLLYLNQVSA